jgi:hypothetical protein
VAGFIGMMRGVLVSPPLELDEAEFRAEFLDEV